MPVPIADIGRLILHRYNGDELYLLKSAVMLAPESEEGLTLWFEVKTTPDGAQRCEDSAELGRWPNAEVGIELPGLDVRQLAGSEFSIPGTASDDEDSCMSLLYYCEHQPLRKNRINVLARTSDRFRLRWTAETQDVIDFRNPLTQVEIEGEFLFKEMDKWANR